MKHTVLFRAVALMMMTGMIGGLSIYTSPKVYAAPAQAEAPKASRIDVNAASSEELQNVRGIGPALAERIISYRNEFGPFEHLDDLAGVRGIGGAKLQKIKSQIRI